MQTGHFQRIPLIQGFRLKKLESGAGFSEFAGGECLRVPHMPAMVHDVLVDHKQIEMPWLPGQAQNCTWVAEKDWLYEVDFAADDPLAVSFLRFEGLDTVVDIYLNGEWLALHGNMFMPLRVAVTGKLRPHNTLSLHFHSLIDAQGKPDHRLKGLEVRRSHHNYDTYLGPNPYFSRVGVYGDIFLEITRGSELSEVLVDAAVDETLTKGSTAFTVSGVTTGQRLRLQIRLFSPAGILIEAQEIPLQVAEGSFHAQTSIEAPQPELWWPRGYGSQPLYCAEVSLWVDGELHQTQSRKVGFRRVTMPEMLHFVVNGVPVRLWGGNWVAPRWQTAVWDQARAEQLLDMAEHANFNTLRIWAETEPPHPSFYEMADARGIMIWHDFALILQDTTQPTTPLSPSRRAAMLEETAHWVKTLKHHPSILLWCGGNEEPLWHSEEFSGKYIDSGPWPVLPAAEEMAALCQKLDPNRFVWLTSPWGGIDPNDPREGDTHGYTNTSFIPGYGYLNFASEDTRIAAPTLPSLKRFMPAEDIWPTGYINQVTPQQPLPFPESWKKYTFSSSWVKTGPVEQFFDATDAPALVHNLGMAEALYYQQTIERQRRGRPAADPGQQRRCGGYLVWKFNDSWPQIYSGKVDYFLEPYHAYYALRRAFQPLLLSFEVGEFIWLWAVNDTPETQTGTVSIQLFNQRLNRVRKETTLDLRIAPGESRVVARLDEIGMASFFREHLVAASFKDSAGKTLADTLALMNIERRCTFPQAKLDVNLNKEGALVITTDSFARTICLTGEELGWFFEDNYFDLLPGHTKTVRILGKHKQGTITARPWYSQHVTQIEWEIS